MNDSPEAAAALASVIMNGTTSFICISIKSDTFDSVDRI